MLYCDDFNPSSHRFPWSSSASSYVIWMRLPFCQRVSVSFVGKIFVTRLGVSSNRSFGFYIPGNEKGTEKGFQCFDETGTNAEVYLDMYEFLGDNPSSSQFLGIMEHIPGASCKHYSLGYRGCSKNSKYSFTTKIHSKESLNFQTPPKFLGNPRSRNEQNRYKLFRNESRWCSGIGRTRHMEFFKARFGSRQKVRKSCGTSTSNCKWILRPLSLQRRCSWWNAEWHCKMYFGGLRYKTGRLLLDHDSSDDGLLCSWRIRNGKMGSHITVSNIMKRTLSILSKPMAYCVKGLLPILLRIIQTNQRLKIFPLDISFAELVPKTFLWPKLEIDRSDVCIYCDGSGE